MAMVEVEGTSTDFDPVPTSRYRVQVTKLEIKPSGKGFPNGQWEADIVTHPEFSGRKLFWNTSLQPQAAWKLADVLEKFRIPHDKVDLGDKKFKVRFDSDLALGKTAHVAVSVVPARDKQGNIVEGKMRNEVEEFFFDD